MKVSLDSLYDEVNNELKSSSAVTCSSSCSDSCHTSCMTTCYAACTSREATSVDENKTSLDNEHNNFVDNVKKLFRKLIILDALGG